MEKNKTENLIWNLFIIVGAIFLLIGIITIGKNMNKNTIDTVGTIEYMEPYTDSNGNRSYRVYVSYCVEGQEYESRLNGYSSSFYTGKQLEIYYNKDNPSQIGMKSLDMILWIFPGIGLILLIIGGTAVISKNNKRKLKKELKENGKLIYANYVDTILDTSYTVNGRSPYKIICEWTDSTDNEKYTFKSLNLWNNPESIIEEKNIKALPVYINMNNKKQYYVDVDSLTDDNNVN